MESTIFSIKNNPDQSIASKPSLYAIERFMADIETIRSAADFESWKVFTASNPALKSWRYFLSADPYTRWGLLKPKGYAGDARLMDFAYRHDSIRVDIEVSGALGQRIYEFTSSASQSESARQRIGLISRKLAEASHSGPIQVISFAAGHARELELLSENVRSQIERFIAIDVDYDAITAAKQSASNISFASLQRNILTSTFDDIRPGHFVYSLGLFDYLTDKLAKRTLQKMWRCLAPNGKLLIANLADDAANLGYCEAIMDWWMIGRTHANMLELGESILLDDPRNCRMTVKREGCFYFLELDRT